MGERWMFHDVIAKTWPERQRILDMLEEDGPWHRITPGEFDLCLEQFQANSELESSVQLNILEQVDLAKYTTFRISALAKWFVRVHNLAELRSALAWASDRGCDLMILGGGSNILLHGDIEKLVIHVQIEGVDVCTDDGQGLEVSAGAGVVWHDFVMHTLDQGWGGLENLSLIPGSVGASPMQNIGAYGLKFGIALPGSMRFGSQMVRFNDLTRINVASDIGKVCSSGRRKEMGSGPRGVSFGTPEPCTWSTAP